MNISIKSDLKRLAKDLTHLQKKQIPFATSQALNDVAIDAQKALKAQAQKKFDRPTKATINSFRYKRSTKRNLTAEVFIADYAVDYLKYQIEGGTRTAAGRGTGVPVNAKLNKYGNITGRRKGLIKNKRQFIATIKGITGVWEGGRMAKGKMQPLKLIVAFEKSVTYRKRFDYFKIINGVVKNKFNKHMHKRLTAAIASAK